MSPNRIAVILAVLLFGGVCLLFFRGGSPQTSAPPPATDQAPATTTATPSTAASYDECIAEGGAPLPDAPDKCLTRDGHIFVKGADETDIP